MVKTKEQDLGTHINQKHYCKFDLDAPDWAKDLPHLPWYAEGVVIWDENQKVVINLNFWQAMELLDSLNTDSSWNTEGCDVSDEYFEINIELKRKKETKENQQQSKSNKIVVQLHLSPKQTKLLLAFLKKNEKLIRTRGHMIKTGYEEAMNSLANMLYEQIIEDEKMRASS